MGNFGNVLKKESEKIMEGEVKNKKAAPIIFILVLVLILIDGFMYMNLRAKTEIIDNTIPLEELVSPDIRTLIEDPEAFENFSWRTYANEEYGFTLEYASLFQEFQPAIFQEGAAFMVLFITQDDISQPTSIVINEKYNKAASRAAEEFLEDPDILGEGAEISESAVIVSGYAARKLTIRQQGEKAAMIWIMFERNDQEYVITGQDNKFFDGLINSFSFFEE